MQQMQLVEIKQKSKSATSILNLLLNSQRQLLPPQSTFVPERSHSELNPTGACLIGRNILSPRSGKSGSNWRPKNFSGPERQPARLSDQLQNPKPIVVKGYGRCCQGNYRAHMRIPDATEIGQGSLAKLYAQ